MTSNLEASLSAGHDGRMAVSGFLETLFQSRVFVLLDRKPGDDGSWDASASPLVLDVPGGAPALALFTSLDRAIRWKDQAPAHPHASSAEFAWLVRGVRSDIGIAINPGHALGAEIDPKTTAQMRTFAQRRHQP